MDITMITLKQINNQIVKAIPLPEIDTRPVKGYDICQEIYANIFLCARKKSGKTSALFKILKECASKKTIIVVFCSTCYKDKNWIQIRKYFENKGMDIRVFTSIYEDGEDQLSNLVEDLKKEAKEEEEKAEESGEHCELELEEILARLETSSHASSMYENEVEEEKQKCKKSKYQAPEYII